jgi:hypothetical protein
MGHDIDLTGYIEGCISLDERTKIEAHLETCPQCRDDLLSMQKSGRIVTSILKYRPDFLCPETESLAEFIVGFPPDSEAQWLEGHIESCAFCREKMRSLKEAAEARVEMPEPDKWEPLPRDLRPGTAGTGGTLSERFKEAVMTLKARGHEESRDLLNRVNDLAEQLVAGAGDRASYFAMEREATLPSQTDLELEIPQPGGSIRIEVENYLLEIADDPRGTRIRVHRDGKIVPGLKVRAVIRGGVAAEGETDDRGDVVIGR